MLKQLTKIVTESEDLNRVQEHLLAVLNPILRDIGAADKFCAARYTTTTAGSYASGGSGTVVNFETKDIDTHNLVRTGNAWRMTIEEAGVYYAHATLTIASHLMAAGNQHQLFLMKNGANIARIATFFAQAAPTTLIGLNGGTLFTAEPQDYVNLVYFQNSGGARALHTTSLYNHISIYRVGDL